MKSASRPTIRSTARSATSARAAVGSLSSSARRKKAANLSRKTHANKRRSGKTSLMQIRTAPAVAFAAQMAPIVSKLRRRLYRRAYLEANIAHGIAHQIRTIREHRGMTQSVLAKRLKTSQTIVSRLEDPSYGRLTLSSLLRVSHAFDVALLVKFVSFPKFLNETADKSPSGLYADSFEESLNAATVALEHGWQGFQRHVISVRTGPFIDTTNVPTLTSLITLLAQAHVGNLPTVPQLPTPISNR